MSAFQVLQNSGGGIPVFGSITVKERGELADGIGNVRLCGNRDVHQASNQQSVQGSLYASVYAPLTWNVLKTPLCHCFMECLIPDLASLFRGVDRLHQLHYPVLLTQNLESSWLLHKHGFSFR